MNDAWGFLNNSSGRSGSLFFRLRDGEQREVVFVGDPLAMAVAFVDGRSVPWDPSFAARGVKKKTIVRHNVWDPKTGAVMIFEMSLQTARLVFGLVELYKEKFHSRSYVIRRTGSGIDTTYSVGYCRDLEPDELDAIAGAKLLDLAFPSGGDKKQDDPAPVQHSAPPAPEDEFEPSGKPLSLEDLVATAQKEQLKLMLSKLGIAKISQIPADRRQEAFNILSEIVMNDDIF